MSGPVFRVERLIPAGIGEVRDTLLRTSRVRRWFPLRFTVQGPEPARFREGRPVTAEARAGDLAMRFGIEAELVSARRIRIVLDGIVRIAIDAVLAPVRGGRGGTRLVADIAIESRNALGGLTMVAVAAAAEQGALERIAERIAAEATSPRGARRPPRGQARSTAGRGRDAR